MCAVLTPTSFRSGLSGSLHFVSSYIVSSIAFAVENSEEKPDSLNDTQKANNEFDSTKQINDLKRWRVIQMPFHDTRGIADNLM